MGSSRATVGRRDGQHGGWSVWAADPAAVALMVWNSRPGEVLGGVWAGGIDDVGTYMVTHDDERPNRTMVSRRFGWVLWAMDPAAVLHGLGGDSSGRDRRHWDMQQLRLKATAAQLSSRPQKLNCGVLLV